ncbi:von Willebrand factor D and EGF domain-containing protein-like [Chelonus insularis]|uniref:von Willebrand factor D and EGF domain-containing protein-like n=1 Tax=Chelonus insularis TaxID=460826 RepID=UPI00158C798B|nr:von Willebrand factor D and EGF domain-containing protein-like [Chelonus insularis]
MFRLVALSVIYFSIGIFISNAQVGIKGGHYQSYQQSPYSQPANRTGYCYKRVPYHHAGSQFNGSHVGGGYNQGVKQSWNNTYSSEWITILDCCDGYIKNQRTNSCEIANCDGNCFGGRCIGGMCTCDSGWMLIEGVCRPICRQPCGPNGYCFTPDVCECNRGWERSPMGDCRPNCPGGCINGDCIAPQTCVCKPGYTLNEVSQKCVPDCEEECRNGHCIAPGVCRCNSGYYDPDGSSKRCLPYCGPKNCGNHGECESPGVCRCRPGYYMNSYSDVCEAPEPGINQSPNPGCDRPCINGVCMGYNVCSCNDGYLPDPNDPTRTRCISGCPGGCPNGVCSGPNLCLCKPGYVKDRSVKGSQRCVPKNNY